MQTYVDTALDWLRAGTAMPFATVERESGQAIGSTRFENIDAPRRRVEVGWSWLNPRWWRTSINTEAKYLMLRHAFERWKCVRVEFKTRVNNHRSRDAILRIGAKEEGVLRRHMLQPDGSFRDAVYFSILDEEWPAVKVGLETKLSRHAQLARIHPA
jgi:N-acetyltransferase